MLPAQSASEGVHGVQPRPSVQPALHGTGSHCPAAVHRAAVVPLHVP
jgi:hypothetical protein